jgi:hypothetical protein
VVSFTLQPLYLRERSPSTHCRGSWVGPRAVPDVVVKRKIPSLCRESKPRTPIVQPFFFRWGDKQVKQVTCYYYITAYVDSNAPYKKWFSFLPNLLVGKCRWSEAK